jgi:hypothetical protein
LLRAGTAAAAGLVLVLGALALTLSQSGTRLAGTNSMVEVSGVALPVAAGRERCARGQLVPAGAAAVRVHAGTYFRPRGEPIMVSVRTSGRVVASGRAPGGYPDNTPLRVPLGPVRANLYDATVCVRNLGRRQLGFAGNLTSSAPGPVYGGPEVIRFDWLLPGRPTWWDVSPRVARRAAVLKPSFVGPWTPWALLGVVGVLWAVSLTVLLRRADS